MARTRLEEACWLAEQGITIFQVESRSKRPLGGYSWMSRCTTDPKQIKEWDAQSDNPNWGAWLGDDYAVIDLDRKASVNGVAAFEEICAENGIDAWELELNTFTVRTPSGGFHLYFKVTSPVANANSFPKGIDVRAAVGFVVISGCEIVNEDGELKYYKVINDAEIIDCPEWLFDKYLRAKSFKDPNRHAPLVEYDLPENIEQAVNWLKVADAAIEGAEGDKRTYDVCCKMRDFGLSEEQTLLTLNNEDHGPSWNQRCDPPWSDGELSVKIENSSRYAENRPGCASATHREDRFKSARPAGGYGLSATQKNDMYNPKSKIDRIVDNSLEQRRQQRNAESGIPENVEDDNDNSPNAPDESKRLWWGIQEFAARDNIREYVIKDWLIAHGVTALLATRGTGKSTIALDLAMHLAHDMDWWGTPTMKGWKVIYICGEDDEGMILNVRAWAKYNNRGLPPDDRFEVADDIIKMTSRTELELRMEEMVKWANGARCVIILDTWARATSGFSANTQEEMDTAYENAEKMAAALEGPMIACFHPPKEGRMTIRGSAVQEDASSGIWTLTDEGTTLKLCIARAKGKGQGRYRHFELKPIDLEGTDFYQERLQGIVPIKVGGTEDEGTQTQIEKLQASKEAWALMVVGCVEFPMRVNKYESPRNLHAEAIGEYLNIIWADAGRGDIDAEEFKSKYMQPAILLGYERFFNSKTGVTSQLRSVFFSVPVKPILFKDKWTVSVDGNSFKVKREKNYVG